MTVVTITREESAAHTPFAKNGNLATQKPAVVWVVRVDGVYKTTERRLSDAKDAASYYGSKFEVVR